MDCETYKAVIPERTCVLRCTALAERKITNSPQGGIQPYHRFSGCLRCERGQTLINAIKKGEDMPQQMEGEKTCSKCRELKPLSQFYNDKKSPDNKSYWCKQCSKISAQDAKKKPDSGHGQGPVPDPIETREEKIEAALEILFENHGDLLSEIEGLAETDFRPVNMQVLFILNQSVHPQKSI